MHITIYQTASRLYCVRHAHDAATGVEEWRVLKLDRTSPQLSASEDPTPYSKPQIHRLLAALHAGNQAHGGLQLVCEAYAIVGSIRFLESPYLLLVTRRRYLGALCGHKVYGIDATALLPVLSPTAHRAAFGSQHAATAEVRYRKLLAGVQLTRDFFFSYTWPVHQSAQRTFEQAAATAAASAGSPKAGGSAGGGADAAGDPGAAFGSHRVWNEYLSRPLRCALGAAQAARWVVPLAHGFFEQRQLALLGRTLQLTLVARRSRQFAGTRYLKRGVTDAGFCANDVEVEQVLEAGVDWKSGQPLLSAVVQVRGSIPLHWAQQPDSSMLKPEIVLHRFDPLYQATRRHFDLLREQYGEPVCVLDLVKRVERRPRESTLGVEYAAAVRYLNQRLPPGQARVQYQSFDLSHCAKTSKTHLLADLQRLQEPVLQATGIFCSGGAPAAASAAPGSGSSAGGSAAAAGGSAGAGAGGSASVAGPAQRQRGVLRTNCIDSLDRTNVAQFTYGMLALGRQLHAMGISDSAWLDPASSMARHLMDLWERLGHTLALQYGGSEAHATFFQRQRGDWEATTQGRDMLTTVRRYLSNVYADADRQDAINLFLGSFVPVPGRPHLWELGSDSYLHTGRIRPPLRAASLGPRPSTAAAAPSAASFAAASAQAAAAAQGDLASFPPPVSLPPPPPAGLQGVLGLPRASTLEADAEAASPPLQESLSAASLVSLSSDGSFAPSLTALVKDASPPQAPRLLSGVLEEASSSGAGAGAPAVSTDEPSTPRAGSSAAAAAKPSPAATAIEAAAAPAAPQAATSPPLPPARGLLRRSPLLSGTNRGKAAKLESLDRLLGRQPVVHVRLTATPPAAPKGSALGWLSPSKSSAAVVQQAQHAGAAKGGSPAATAAAAAAVAAAGVVNAPAGVAMPAGGLRRSNSDPSLASSLNSLSPIPLAPAPPAIAAGTAGVGRRVTFEGIAASPRAGAGPAAAGGPPRLQRHSTGAAGVQRRARGLQRHSTAPTASLEELATAAAAAAASGGLAHPFGSGGMVGQLVLVESAPDEQLTWSGSSLLGALRRSSASYHSLAGLNLEGAAAVEASIKPGTAAPSAAAAPAGKPAQQHRRLSLARLRSLGVRKSSLAHPGGSGLSPAGSASAPAEVPVGIAPSLLQPSPSVRAGNGAPEPLSMSAVVFGAEAVRRGVDTLGVPPAAPTWWLTGADPLAAMMEEQQRLQEQILRQREALATSLDPVEQRALMERCAALMRPSWALHLTDFAAAQAPQTPPPAAAEPVAPAPPAGGARSPAVPGLAF